MSVFRSLVFFGLSLAWVRAVATPTMKEISKFAITSTEIPGNTAFPDVNELAFAMTTLSGLVETWVAKYAFNSAVPLPKHEVAALEQNAARIPYLRFVHGLLTECPKMRENPVNCYEAQLGQLSQLGQRLWGTSFRNMIESKDSISTLVQICKAYGRQISLSDARRIDMCATLQDILAGASHSALKSREHSFKENQIWPGALFVQDGAATVSRAGTSSALEGSELNKAELDKMVDENITDKTEAAKVKGIVQSQKISSMWGDLTGEVLATDRVKAVVARRDVAALAEALTAQTYINKQRAIQRFVGARNNRIVRDLSVNWQNSPYHKWIMIYSKQTFFVSRMFFKGLIEPMILSVFSI